MQIRVKVNGYKYEQKWADANKSKSERIQVWAKVNGDKFEDK